MFCCVLNRDGEPVSPGVRARCAGRMRRLAGNDRVEELEAGEFVAWVVPARVPLRPLWARRGRRVAVGNVRLDHPEEVRGRAGTLQPAASSLELLLDAYDAEGDRCLCEAVGDFSLVLFDARSRRLVAGRDALGVKTLFVGERGRVIVLSSHLEMVHENEMLDEEFIADFLLGGDPGPERTVWADSRAIPQGSLMVIEGGRITIASFWTPHEFSIVDAGAEADQIEQFRDLFAKAVQVRLGPETETWAELSGGLDSSSVVCMAHHLRRTGTVDGGIGGTVTLADELGEGDEREYSRLVVGRCGVRNEVVLNPWPWQDDGREPPRTDEPRAHYPYFARDRAVSDLVRAAGGTVLLGGWGADHYLFGSKLFLSDALARGKVLDVLRLAVDWSVGERKSFWSVLTREAVLPLLPSMFRRHFAASWDRIPDWIEPGFARRISLCDRLASARTAAVPRGHRFEREVANNVQELTRWLPRGSFEAGLEPRYPFMYRPLVEFGLRLSPAMRVRPLTQKWILRQAMSGVLPEQVRLRPGKGGIDARLLWALSRERGRLDDITREPVLASVGVVSPVGLRRAVEAARQGTTSATVMLLCALGLETWLFVRSGRWTVSGGRYPNQRVEPRERRSVV